MLLLLLILDVSELFVFFSGNTFLVFFKCVSLCILCSLFRLILYFFLLLAFLSWDVGILQTACLQRSVLIFCYFHFL